MEGALHTSCTIEMVNLAKRYDVAVIDEIQVRMLRLGGGDLLSSLHYSPGRALDARWVMGRAGIDRALPGVEMVGNNARLTTSAVGVYD